MGTICYNHLKIEKAIQIPTVKRLVSLGVVEIFKNNREKSQGIYQIDDYWNGRGKFENPESFRLNDIFSYYKISHDSSGNPRIVFTSETISTAREEMNLIKLRRLGKIDQKLQKSKLIEEILLEDMFPGDYENCIDENRPVDYCYRGSHLFFRTIPLHTARQGDKIIKLIYGLHNMGRTKRDVSNYQSIAEHIERIASKNSKLAKILEEVWWEEPTTQHIPLSTPQLTP